MSEAARVVLIGAARTPFGRFGGALRDWRLAPLAAVAIAGALSRAAISSSQVAELALGVNLPGSDRSVARQAALRADMPVDLVAYTVDRACCSSMAALDLAARSVAARPGTIAVAGGAENMSRVPYFLEDLRWGNRLGDVTLADQLVISCPYTGVPRAVQAADEAALHHIGRDEQDDWALRSQLRWSEAASGGRFDAELVSVDRTGGRDALLADECPRPDTTREQLARLPCVNGSSTVTAGNAPNMATGASAAVVTTEAEAGRLGARPIARILAIEAVSGPPANIASVPAIAARKALASADVKLDDIDLIEINEAFAAVPLVTTAVLADGDALRKDRLRERTNVNGGAIAVGHPTGATALRLVMTLADELRRRGGGLGLATICGGIGEGHAAVIEVDAA